MLNISERYIRQNLLSKIEYFNSSGYIFSHISEMNITFITYYKNMTYEYYPKQSKSMLEWKLNEKLARNTELKRAFNRNTSHPLIRKYDNVV